MPQINPRQAWLKKLMLLMFGKLAEKYLQRV
jgi:hypothetical protein